MLVIDMRYTTVHQRRQDPNKYSDADERCLVSSGTAIPSMSNLRLTHDWPGKTGFRSK